MLKALFRKAWADVAQRPLQTGMVFAIVTAVTAILAAAVTTQVSVDRAYMVRFNEGNGAHVWFAYSGKRLSYGGPSELMRIGEAKEVTATSGPIPFVSGIGIRPLLDGGAVNLRLFGLPSVFPEVGKPIVTRGRWLSSGGNREIVLDRGLAHTRDIEIGDWIELLGRESSQTFEVVGLSMVTEGMSYPYAFYALGYVLPAALEMMEPDHDKWEWKYGVRLQDPEAAMQFARTVSESYPSGQRPSFTTWQMFKNDIDGWTFYYNMFLILAAAFVAGVAVFVIVNVVIGNLLMRFRDIGLLKSVGFTPRQVLALLLVEHAGVGLVAAVVGAAIGYIASPLVLRVTAQDIMGISASPVFDLPLMTITVLGVTLVIAATAFLPSWRSARISTVRALTSGISTPPLVASRSARIAALLRLPVAVIMGFKNLFNRPVRSVLCISSLAVVVILAIFCLAIETTFRDIIEDPRLVGLGAYEMTAAWREGADEVSLTEVKALLEDQSDIDSYYAEREFVANLVDGGGDGTGLNNKLVRAVTGEGFAALAPYISEGWLFSQSGEAIISRQMARKTGLGLGETLALVFDGDPSGDMEIDGRKLTLRVVGIFLTQEQTDIRTSLDTVRQQLDLNLEPTHYRIKLAPEADAETLKIDLLSQSNDQLSVVVFDHAKENKQLADDIRPPVYAVTGALFVIGIFSVLITLLFTVWERYREFGILKTLGFTPREIVTSIASASVVLAGIALIVGIPLGIVFTRLALVYLGNEIGVGAPFGTMPGPLGIALVAPLILLIACLGSVFPARRAAGITVNEALRFE